MSAAPAEAFRGYYSNPPGGTTQTRSLLLRNQVEAMHKPPRDNDSFYSQENLQGEILPKEVSISALAAQSIVSDFKKKRDHYEKSERISRWTIDGISGFMQGTLAFAGPAGAVGSIVVAAATGWLKDILVENRFTFAKDKLAMDMKRYHDDHGNFSDLLAVDETEGKGGLARYNKLYDADHPVLNEAFEEISDEGRALLQGTLIKMLAKADQATWVALANQGERLNEQGVKINDLERTVTHIDQAFVNFRDKTVKRLEDVEEKVKDINAGLNKVRERVMVNEKRIRENTDNIAVNKKLISENRRDIEFLQESMFGKMDPREQVEALKRGIFNGMDPVELEKLEAKVALAAKRKDLMDTMNGFVNGANDLLDIANGLEIKVPNEVSIAVGAATNLLNAGTAFASGDYLGAVKSVVALAGLGKKKIDVGAERHKQVMTVLSKLAQGQHQILGNQERLLKWAALFNQRLDQILENQRVMFEAMIAIDAKINKLLQGQQDIFNALVQLSEQLEDHHDIMMKQLADIVQRLVFIRLQVRSNALDGIPQSKEALRYMLSHEKYIEDENRFADYPAVLNFYLNARVDLKPAMTTLLKQVTSPGTHSDISFFELGGLDVEAVANRKKAMIDHYGGLKEFVIEHLIGVHNKNQLEELLSSLIHPVQTVHVLNNKLETLQVPNSGSSEVPRRLPDRLRDILHPVPGVEEVEVPRLISELYSTDFITEVAGYVLRFHPLLAFYKNGEVGGDFYTFDEFREAAEKKGGLSNRGKRFLIAATARLDIAIAQQSMITGDALLPMFTELLLQRQGSNAEKRMTALLNQNHLLTKNFVMYAFHHAVIGRYVDYTVAYHERENPRKLKNLLGNQWNFRWDPEQEKWFVRFVQTVDEREDVNEVEIPAPAELQEGKLMTTQATQRLLNWRATLVQEILEYDYPDSLGSIEKNVYMRGLALKV